MPILTSGIDPFIRAMDANERSLELSSSNIANANTPGYAARKIDFSAYLEGVQNQVGLARTSERHIAGSFDAEMGVKYRNTGVVSGDDNNVNVAQEQVEFKKSSQSYEMAMNIISGKKKTLEEVLSK